MHERRCQGPHDEPASGADREHDAQSRIVETEASLDLREARDEGEPEDAVDREERGGPDAGPLEGGHRPAATLIRRTASVRISGVVARLRRTKPAP